MKHFSFKSRKVFPPLKLATQIQQQYTGRLWIYLSDNDILINGDFNDRPTPLNINDTVIEHGRQELIEAGFPPEGPLFACGHDYGATLVAYQEVQEFPELALGVIMIGASGIDYENYPKPVMLVAGDLDGNTRITKVSNDFRWVKCIYKICHIVN